MAESQACREYLIRILIKAREWMELSRHAKRKTISILNAKAAAFVKHKLN